MAWCVCVCRDALSRMTGCLTSGEGLLPRFHSLIHMLKVQVG